jgi:hypothetical protein
MLMGRVLFGMLAMARLMRESRGRLKSDKGIISIAAGEPASGPTGADDKSCIRDMSS